MAKLRRVYLSRETTCIRCHKKIGKGKYAISEKHGLSFYSYHPSCYKSGYEWHHSRYIKKVRR